MTTPKGRLVRLSDYSRRSIAYAVADAAVKEKQKAHEEAKDAFVTELVRLWWGEDRHLGSTIPERFLPLVQMAYVNGGNDSIRLPIGQRLPFNPPWCEAESHYNYMTVKCPTELLAQLHVLSADGIELRNESDTISHRLRNALRAFRFVRDAREALPEIGAFLPADRESVDPNAPTQSRLLPAVQLTPLREMLASYGFAPPEVSEDAEATPVA